VRKINLEAIEQWSEAVGAEVLIGSVGAVIVKDNPEIRTVLLDWVVTKKDSIAKAELGSLPKALVSCLQDKAPKIRGMAELVIIEVLPHTGPAPFKKIVKDLKPAVQNSVKPLMTKCIDAADIGDDGADEAPAKVKSGKAKPEEDKGASDKALPAALAKAKGLKGKKDKSRPKTAAPMTAQEIHAKLNKKPMALAGKKKAGDELEFQILDVGRKDKRNEADKKKRWHPEEIRGDYVEKLKGVAKSMFGDVFSTKMFSSDFKQHMKCIKAIRTVFDNEEMFESFLEVIDVIIKWAYIKSNEISNISFLKELYTFFDEIINFLIEREYQFMEAEGNIFCLCLVEKIGMNNNIMKEKIKEIIMKVGNSTVYFPKKLMSILMKGLNSKNTKTTAECCECIAQMVQAHQLEAINEKDVKVIAKQCESGDNGIRQGALLAVEEIYKITGDQFWTLVGDKLSTKAKDIIMARLNAHLGISLNSTPIEDKKDTLKADKSPMVGKGSMRSSGMNKSLNKSFNNKGKLNSSIPMSERRLGRNDNEESKSNIESVQSSSNISRKMDGMTTPRRRKDSSVNRKLERISSASRKTNELEANLEREIDKIKNKAKDGEVIQEILLLSEDPSYELDENLDSIGKNIKQLKYGDLSGKVDALVIINE